MSLRVLVFVCLCATCVVVLGAVPQVRLVLEDELGEGQALGHLHRAVLLPLEDQVVHGVSDWRTKEQVGSVTVLLVPTLM